MGIYRCMKYAGKVLKEKKKVINNAHFQGLGKGMVKGCF